MKKLLYILTLLISVNVSAQKVITFGDGSGTSSADLSGYVARPELRDTSEVLRSLIGGSALSYGYGLALISNNVIVDSLKLTSWQRLKKVSDSIISVLTVAIATKQATLVSGTNIKTINGTSILGSGDLTIAGGGGSTTDASLLTSGTLNDARLSGNVALLAATQTFTNKTISGASNTITNIPQSAITNLISNLAAKADLSGGTVPTSQLPTIDISTALQSFFQSIPGWTTTGTITLKAVNGTLTWQ